MKDWVAELIIMEVAIIAVTFISGALGVWTLFAAFAFLALIGPVWIVALSSIPAEVINSLNED